VLLAMALRLVLLSALSLGLFIFFNLPPCTAVPVRPDYDTPAAALVAAPPGSSYAWAHVSLTLNGSIAPDGRRDYVDSNFNVEALCVGGARGLLSVSTGPTPSQRFLHSLNNWGGFTWRFGRTAALLHIRGTTLYIAIAKRDGSSSFELTGLDWSSVFPRVKAQYGALPANANVLSATYLRPAASVVIMTDDCTITLLNITTGRISSKKAAGGCPRIFSLQPRNRTGILYGLDIAANTFVLVDHVGVTSFKPVADLAKSLRLGPIKIEPGSGWMDQRMDFYWFQFELLQGSRQRYWAQIDMSRSMTGLKVYRGIPINFSVKFAVYNPSWDE